MREIIALILVLLGFTLIILTVVYRRSLTSDHCCGLGFLGFLSILFGVMLVL